MQNSSFLFNYDSEDSSAHYSSTYQPSSQNQPNGQSVERNSMTDSETHTNHSERQSVELGDSTKSNSPENERDGSAPADTAAPKHQEVQESSIDENNIAEEINVDEDTSEALRSIVDASSTQSSPTEPSPMHESHGRIDARTVWQNTLAELMLQMPTATYDTWMRDTSVIAYEDGEFIIGLPNAYARDWIMNRLQTKIKRILGKLIGRSVQVTFRVVPIEVVDRHDASPAPLYDSLQDGSAKANPSPTDHVNDESISHGIDSLGSQAETNQQMTQQANRQASTNRFADNPSFTSAPTETFGSDNNSSDNNGYNSNNGLSTSYNAPQSGGTNSGSANSSLQQGYTFDTFIVGSHNQLAHAAAASIADGPGNSFNPLFIYGGVGLGKTHLLHAVGNLAIARGSRVLYCTSEQFTNELISSIRGRGTEAFRSKYRQVDVLLIDDIQFIAGKESTQEEFFHTFNHLHTAGRQVVLSSDRPPKALATLEERLRSRFEGGLLTDISQPDFETRVAILQSKANKSGIRINSDVLMLIAERVDSNIRELEGALNRMVVQARLFSSTLDLQLAESILRNLAPQRTPRSPSIVIDIVADHFHLTAGDMCGRSRTKEIAHARQIIMYLLREENAMSLPSIGDQLGGRDHSTVRHGVEKINKDLEHDEQLRREIMALRDKIYAAPESS